MTHDEDGPPTVYEQVAVLRRSLTLLTEELKRAVDERDTLRALLLTLRRCLDYGTQEPGDPDLLDAGGDGDREAIVAFIAEALEGRDG